MPAEEVGNAEPDEGAVPASYAHGESLRDIFVRHPVIAAESAPRAEASAPDR